jgi:hypothetical protein
LSKTAKHFDFFIGAEIGNVFDRRRIGGVFQVYGTDNQAVDFEP